MYGNMHKNNKNEFVEASLHHVQGCVSGSYSYANYLLASTTRRLKCVHQEKNTLFYTKYQSLYYLKIPVDETTKESEIYHTLI